MPFARNAAVLRVRRGNGARSRVRAWRPTDDANSKRQTVGPCDAAWLTADLLGGSLELSHRMNLFGLAATLRNRANPALVVSAALTATAGCTSVDEAISAHGKAAEASVVRIEAVRAAMAAQPPLASAGFDTGGASLVVDLTPSDSGE